MTFKELSLHPSLLKALNEDRYEHPTPIQAAAIPVLLNGHDLVATAQTGTGKTAAFALPILDRLVKTTPYQGKKRPIQTLILAPTRELANQIKDSIDRYSRKNHIKAIAVFGGVAKRNQIIKLKRGVDILIATPGRLLDLMNMNVVKLHNVHSLVLDEVDQMLDMGFIDDVKKITDALPKTRQTMLFSATLPAPIEALAKRLLNEPKRLEMAPQNQPLETITQAVYFMAQRDKIALLKTMLEEPNMRRVLIFVRTKRYAEQLFNQLDELGYHVASLHGDKSQMARQAALKAFKTNQINVLIATDVAARGLDIDTLSHVINFDMPQTPETYIHRIGRTARAGALGAALSFCIKEETHLLKAIQKHVGFTLPVEANHPYALSLDKPASKPRFEHKKKPSKNQKKKGGFYAQTKGYNLKKKRYAH